MPNLSEDLFQFLDKPEVHEHFTNDLNELHGCMKQGLWKASIILIGSLIENVLYYYIDNVDALKNSIPNFEKRTIGLNDLLGWARQHQIIDENLFRLTEPIREYRNTIHPRVTQRLKLDISESLVQIGYNVFLEVVRHVNLHYKSIKSQSIETLISDTVVKIANRKATRADIYVYVPILEKYGRDRGTMIIERSLKLSLPRFSGGKTKRQVH